MFSMKDGLTLDAKKKEAKNNQNLRNIGFFTSLYLFILMVMNIYTHVKRR